VRKSATDSKKHLDENFWIQFSKTYWEKRSLVIKNIESNLLELDEREVFRLVVLAADQSRRDRSPLGFKFFVNGYRSSEEETLFVLPKKSDRTLIGYNERMERIYQDYCLVCDELLQVNQDKQTLLNQFTRQLYRHVGLPNRFTEMGLYLGNYRKTPFGVHIDRCGVFSFPVVGEKRFREWSSSYVKKNPDLERSFRYAKHKPSSKLLQAKPGDMAYWPSSSWHIAESDGKFSATWSLGVWVDRPTRDIIGDQLISLIAQKIGSSVDATTLSALDFGGANGQISVLPKIFDQAIAVFQKLSTVELQDSFREVWMKQIAGHGMKTLAREADQFKIGTKLRLRNSASPILWTRLEATNDGKNEKFAFCFGKGPLQTSHSRALLKLIGALNSGETCHLKKCLKENRRHPDFVALQQLGDSGAFFIEREM